jgi:hypothetical protein
MTSVVHAAGKVGVDPYARIDAISEEVSRSSATFSGLLASEPRVICPDAWAALENKHDLIRSWQQTSLRLLAASIREDIPRTIASALLDHLPQHFGWGHHARLDWQPVSPPVFFRTDQAADGTVLEVQCPGSLSGVHEIVHAYYSDAGFDCARKNEPLSALFAEALRSHLGRRPVVHHLLDNSSHPAGERFFIQRVRPHAAYFGFDKDVRPQDCNFVRAHDFFGLLTENFAAERLRRSADGTCVYDLPPVALFDQKLLLAFPFWDETRGYFSDAIRNLFPYTAIVAPGGLRLETGDWVTLEQFAALARGKRRYFLKYAGADVARNWGSRAVFRLGTETSEACLARLRAVVGQYETGERWIVQRECSSDEDVSFMTREGEIQTISARSKHSAFYGPTGMLAAAAMFETFFKVHMSAQTIVTVLFPAKRAPGAN